jgi:hypothetical protein
VRPTRPRPILAGRRRAGPGDPLALRDRLTWMPQVGAGATAELARTAPGEPGEPGPPVTVSSHLVQRLLRLDPPLTRDVTAQRDPRLRAQWPARKFRFQDWIHQYQN